MNAPVRLKAECARIKALADADWDALPHEPDPRVHAARHLAALSADRRAMLEAEWATLIEGKDESRG